jgi:hypothetical protein
MFVESTTCALHRRRRRLHHRSSVLAASAMVWGHGLQVRWAGVSGHVRPIYYMLDRSLSSVCGATYTL